MQYMIAFYETDRDFKARDGADAAQFWPQWQAYFAALRETGVDKGGVPLCDPASAATVRGGAEGRIVQDGPYADTKEQLGGYVVVDVPSLDDALAWARRAPSVANGGAVEVRPLWPAASEAAAEQASAGTDAMTYALAIYESPADFAERSGPRAQQYWSAWSAFSSALHDAGVRTGGAPLGGPQSATVVRSGPGGPVLHDGPYADTKEQLGGVLLIDAPNMDEALRWAARCPATMGGAVEVRPVLQIAAPV